MNGMFLTKEDEERYNKYTKEDIYKAYLLEVETRKRLNIEVNKLHRQMAELRYDLSNML